MKHTVHTRARQAGHRWRRHDTPWCTPRLGAPSAASPVQGCCGVPETTSAATRHSMAQSARLLLAESHAAHAGVRSPGVPRPRTSAVIASQTSTHSRACARKSAGVRSPVHPNSPPAASEGGNLLDGTRLASGRAFQAAALALGSLGGGARSTCSVDGDEPSRAPSACDPPCAPTAAASPPLCTLSGCVASMPAEGGLHPAKEAAWRTAALRRVAPAEWRPLRVNSRLSPSPPPLAETGRSPAKPVLNDVVDACLHPRCERGEAGDRAEARRAADRSDATVWRRLDPVAGPPRDVAAAPTRPRTTDANDMVWREASMACRTQRSRADQVCSSPQRPKRRLRASKRLWWRFYVGFAIRLHQPSVSAASAVATPTAATAAKQPPGATASA